MKKFSEEENQKALSEAPEWLRDALAAQRVSPGFRERCREAAMVAHSIAIMRKTRANSGFVPDTLERYINELARNSGVRMEPIVRWLGIKSMARPEPTDGRAFARLGNALGMKPADIVGHITVSLRVAEGRPALPLGRSMHNKIPPNIAGVVDQMEAELSLEAKQKLRLMKAEIEKEYGSSS